MQNTKTTAKLKAWPTPQDYNEAIQNPHHNLSDPELQSGKIEANKLGLPKPITGAFASVYRVHCKDKDYAVRCFLRDIPDAQWRYERISDFVQHDDLTSHRHRGTNNGDARQPTGGGSFRGGRRCSRT